jgi:DNA-binding MarR family transcriptional regulator
MDPQPVELERIQRIASFRVALRAFLSAGERTAQSAGLTPAWYLLLLLIKGAPDGTQRSNFAQLAERMKLSRNTVTDLVHRAEAEGLVIRRPSDQDGRVVYLELTPEGDRRLASAIGASDRDRRELARELEDIVALYRDTTE